MEWRVVLCKGRLVFKLHIYTIHNTCRLAQFWLKIQAWSWLRRPEIWHRPLLWKRGEQDHNQPPDRPWNKRKTTSWKSVGDKPTYRSSQQQQQLLWEGNRKGCSWPTTVCLPCRFKAHGKHDKGWGFQMKLSRNFYQETNHACNRGSIIHSENKGFIFNIRKKMIFISSPWIWAIWYWESKELAQWSPALGLHIFQILWFWVLIQPLWRNGQEADQLGPTSSPV